MDLVRQHRCGNQAMPAAIDGPAPSWARLTSDHRESEPGHGLLCRRSGRRLYALRAPN